VPLRIRVIPRTDPKTDEGKGPTTERIVEFKDDLDEIRIGRRADIELSLPFKALSGLHARLVHKRAGNAGRGNVWLIEDLESKNGTFVGKSRLRRGEQRLLFAGDMLDLGPVQLMFDGHTHGTEGAEGTGTIARRLVNDMLLASPETGAPTLTVISGAPNVETLKLLDRDRPYYIGRGPTCDLRFDLDELSRQHASFTRTLNGVVLRDLGSKNGIHVNTIVAITQRLSDGDLIEMGPLKLRLLDPEDRYLRDLEEPERAVARAPRGDPSSKPAIVMPAALSVSVPQASAFEAPPPNAPPPAAGGAGRKASRLAPRPSAAASAPRLEAPVLDEHHPALAARRPPADAVAPAPEDRTLERQTRKTMWLAVAVLVAIAALVAYLTLGGGSPDGG
jgi:pSer/pThr/pTyr-binding forkhead associated (FHA) protein